MKLKTEQELQANYDRFIGIIKKYFTGERLEKLLHMYSEEELGSNLAVSPASGSKHYHNAYFGGYINANFEAIATALNLNIQQLLAISKNSINEGNRRAILLEATKRVNVIGSIVAPGHSAPPFIPRINVSLGNSLDGSEGRVEVKLVLVAIFKAEA